ncbi:hypothetical protein E1262_25410 [Jiangella aurantiaca]|uniref:TrwC relaxase domain-containing protein n=1 Tax=Jiangella aurantiaca TaxID=2530373 RepID=A0A4R5A3I7_9ACTN|nr:hypothetical protein E1262_25410 [Jiangella aurantiaca]
MPKARAACASCWRARVISIKELHAGDGYRYLLRGIVADSDQMPGVSAVTAYYTEAGNPPGRWMGSGLAGLAAGDGLAPGTQVTEEQMERLYRSGADPLTGAQLGRAYRVPKSFDERVAARVSALPAAMPPTERNRMVEQIEAEERSRRVGHPVSGFDVTFSPPKSVSVMWALADHGVREQIYEAHRAAVADVIATIEREVARTRIGTNGVAQVETAGVIAAAFDHWDSRAGDPQLHTHVVIANRVQGPGRQVANARLARIAVPGHGGHVRALRQPARRPCHGPARRRLAGAGSGREVEEHRVGARNGVR